MASPQKENGYTPIANELLEAMAKCNCFGFSNGQIVWAILRKTYGWNKKEDKISLSQLGEMTGLSRRTIIYTLQELEAKKILFIIREKQGKLNKVNLIKFNKDYETWVVQNSALQVIKNREKAKISSAKLRTLKRGSAKLGKRVVQNSVKNGNSFAPTKETIQKTYTKDIYSEQSSQIKQLFEVFYKINPTINWGNKTSRKAAADLIKKFGLEGTLKMAEQIVAVQGQPYAPRATTPYQMKEKLAEFKIYFDSQKNINKLNKPKIIKV